MNLLEEYRNMETSANMGANLSGGKAMGNVNREALEKQAAALMASGEYEKLHALFSEIHLKGGLTHRLIETIGQCFIQLGDLRSAEQLIDEADKLTGNEGRTDSVLKRWLRLHGVEKQGWYGTRSWCRQNADIIRYLESQPGLDMLRGRFWEYPFVFKKVMEKPHSKIVDIGIGKGIFASILASHGHHVVGVDNYRSCWEDMRGLVKTTGIPCIHADARSLKMFKDDEFDVAMMISMIEHVPSNTIWCEKRNCVKTGAMLRLEMPEKVEVISEALRIVRPGGRVILTSDIYLDHAPEMNISWKELIGLHGINREDIIDLTDVYISDNPIHKGRGVPVGIVLRKSPLDVSHR